MVIITMDTVKIVAGDLVRVVAPAGRGAQQNLAKIKAYVESLNLRVEITDNIYNSEEPFYSNFDEFRADDLISAILNEECKVIWCIRGGSGSNRLIQYLEERLPEAPPTPKLLIGYSDITVLHIYLQKRYNWQTIHGAMLEAIVNGTYDPISSSVESIMSLLFLDVSPPCFPIARIDEGNTLEEPIRGKITGGNLTLVQASIGTLWEIDTADKIIFLEDINVAAYFLERVLEHVIQTGLFERAKAVIFGDFTDPDSPQLIQFVLKRFAKDHRITCPVFVVEGIGHGPVNVALPLNTAAEIALLSDTGDYILCDSRPTPQK